MMQKRPNELHNLEQQVPPTSTPRSYKACATCRNRKVRCIPDEGGATSCQQCLKESVACIFQLKRRKYDSTNRFKKKTALHSGHLGSTKSLSEPLQTMSVSTERFDLPCRSETPSEEIGVRSSADALVFLSSSARTQDDKSPSVQGLQTNDLRLPMGGGIEAERQYQQSIPHETQLSGSNLDLSTTHASNNTSVPQPLSNDGDFQSEVADFRCKLFLDSIILPYEAVELMSFFFKNLYPFFPFLPLPYYESFSSPKPAVESIRPLFEEDVVLLGALVTVTSRYHHLPHIIGGYGRSLDIHNRCWQWTKSQISKVIFEGARPNSILPIIEAMMVLVEWVPKSIHAYLDQADFCRVLRGGTVVNSEHSLNEVILQPAFRTDHVAWSYIGNAFLLLRSLSPSRRICPIFKSPNRYLIALFGCLIMSQSLARRLGRPTLMKFEDVDLEQISNAFEDRHTRMAGWTGELQLSQPLSLGNSLDFHKAFVDLMKLLNHAQNILHPPALDGIALDKRPLVEPQRGFVTLLQHFDSLNRDWKTKNIALFDETATSMSSFSCFMLNLDYEYLRLYEFSTSLSAYSEQKRTREPSAKTGVFGQTGGSQGISGDSYSFSPASLEYYVQQAADAAKKMLDLILSFRSPKTKTILRYASSRHYMKTVFAAVFLIQVLRRNMPTLIPRESLIATLNDIIVSLENASIDDAHPAFRYSILLREILRKGITGYTPAAPGPRFPPNYNAEFHTPQEIASHGPGADIQPASLNTADSQESQSRNFNQSGMGGPNLTPSSTNQSQDHGYDTARSVTCRPFGNNPNANEFAFPSTGASGNMDFDFQWDTGLNLLDEATLNSLLGPSFIDQYNY